MNIIGKTIQGIVEQALNDTHVALPARIEKYNPQKMRADVLPLQKVRLQRGGNPVDMPVITNVPVAAMKAGPFIIRPPYKRGDVVIVVFAERALDLLLVNGQPQHPKYKRRHALDDAIVIGGLMHLAETSLPGEHAEDFLLLHRQQNTKLVIEGATGNVLLDATDHQVKTICKELVAEVSQKATVTSPLVEVNSADIRLGGTTKVARVGDPVQVDIATGAGTITDGSNVVKAG